MMDKKTVIISIIVPVFTVLMSVFLVKYLDDKGESVKIQNQKFKNLELKIDNLTKISSYDIQSLKDQFLTNEIIHNKLLSSYKLDQQNKLNELSADIQKINLQFQ